MAVSKEMTDLRSVLFRQLGIRAIEDAYATLEQARLLASASIDIDNKAAVYEMEAEIHRVLFHHSEALLAYDKAIRLFKKTANHSAYISALMGKAGVYYVKSEYRRCVAICTSALAIAEQPGVELNSKAEVAKLLGISLTYTGQLAEAIRQTEVAIQLFGAQKNQRQLAGCYQNLAIAQRSLGDFQKAIESILNAIHLFEQLELPLNAASATDLLGTITSENGNPHKALEYLLQAKAIREKYNDRKGLYYSHISLGSALFHLQKYKQALVEADNAQALVIGDQRPAELCRVHVCKASVYIEMEEWELAQEHCEAAQALAQTNHDARTEAEVWGVYGKYYLRTAQYAKAKQMLVKSSAIGREKEIWPHVQKCEELLYEIAEAEGNAAMALHHYRQITTLREQQLDAQIQQRMLMLQFQFDLKQKDAELDRLKLEKQDWINQRAKSTNIYHLTPRELTILKLLTEGLSYKQTAAQLGITYETTKEHVGNLYKKLGVKTNTEAVAKAMKEGLV